MVDHFETTPNLATFSLGFVVSQFEVLNGSLINEDHSKGGSDIHVYYRQEFEKSAKGVHEKVLHIQQILTRYLATSVPSQELKIVALPNVAMVRAADSFGLIVIR